MKQFAVWLLLTVLMKRNLNDCPKVFSLSLGCVSTKLGFLGLSQNVLISNKGRETTCLLIMPENSLAKTEVVVDTAQS